MPPSAATHPPPAPPHMQKRREYRPLSEISALDQQAVAAEARVQLLRQQSSSSFTSGSTRLSLRSSVSSVASEDDAVWQEPSRCHLHYNKGRHAKRRKWVSLDTS